MLCNQNAKVMKVIKGGNQPKKVDACELFNQIKETAQSVKHQNPKASKQQVYHTALKVVTKKK